MTLEHAHMLSLYILMFISHIKRTLLQDLIKTFLTSFEIIPLVPNTMGDKLSIDIS